MWTDRKDVDANRPAYLCAGLVSVSAAAPPPTTRVGRSPCRAIHSPIYPVPQ